MYDLILLRYNEWEMRMDAVAREVEWERAEDQLVHHLSLIYFEVEIGLIITKRLSVSRLTKGN